jgi:TRAP-type C4-dicarboxylate transport system permease small subunit
MSSMPLLSPSAPGPVWVTWVGRLVDWSVIGIGAVMALLVFFNVSLHLVDKDLAWVTELGELLMVWVTFLGGACAAQRGMHMSINEFVDKLGDAQRRWADVAILVLSLAVLLILTHYGWILVDVNWENQLTVLGWPMAVQYMGMAVGCSLAAFFVAFDLVQTLRGVPRSERYPSSH